MVEKRIYLYSGILSTQHRALLVDLKRIPAISKAIPPPLNQKRFTSSYIMRMLNLCLQKKYVCGMQITIQLTHFFTHSFVFIEDLDVERMLCIILIERTVVSNFKSTQLTLLDQVKFIWKAVPTLLVFAGLARPPQTIESA